MKKYIKMQKQREKKKITLKALGDKLGVTKQYVWDLESGRLPISYKMAYKISKILDSTPDELFLEDFKKEVK